jgi:hypothetical protein
VNRDEQGAARRAWHQFRETAAASDEVFAPEVTDMEFGTKADRWWVDEATNVMQLHGPGDDFLVDRERYPYHVWKRRGEPNAWTLDSGDVVDILLDELPLSARRLVGKEQDLFLETNRMKGEVEFRYTVAIPVAVAVGVIGGSLALPLWIAALIAVAGAAIAVALLLDGWRRDRLRNDFLIELLAINKAESPTFERLAERARTAEDASAGNDA